MFVCVLFGICWVFVNLVNVANVCVVNLENMHAFSMIRTFASEVCSAQASVVLRNKQLSYEAKDVT